VLLLRERVHCMGRPDPLVGGPPRSPTRDVFQELEKTACDGELCTCVSRFLPTSQT
jgi:hypothetical protein